MKNLKGFKNTGNVKKAAVISILLAAVLAGAAAAGFFWLRQIQSDGAFTPGTTINSEDVSGDTPREAAQALVGKFRDGQVTVTENGKEVFTSYLSELGYAPDTRSLEITLSELEKDGKKTIKDILYCLAKGRSFQVDVPWISDEGTLRERFSVNALSEPRTENTDAKILYYKDEGICRIKPEIQGTMLEDKALQDWLEGEIDAAVEARTKIQKEKTEGQAATDVYDITVSIPGSLYVRPEKCADDKALQEKCAILNKYTGESITYAFGDKTEVLGFDEFMNWLKIQDGKVSVREEKVREYVSGIAARYNTRYLDRDFVTTAGDTVTFPAGLNEYGYTVLEKEEGDQLVKDILSGESVVREPVYMQCNDWGNPYYLKRNGEDDLAGTYVEVSISAQHMWFYIDGNLIVESDVVTGDTTLGLGTATGVFPLAFKESPSILRGGEGRGRYETKVQYWMPFYNGQGLHDADWKTVFGGNEYLGNGSHGCVNLPHAVAETLYNNIEPGTAVILYW